MGDSSRTVLRVAVVGAGNAGRQHIEACERLSGVDVVAVVDPDVASAERTGLPARELDDVLGGDVDAVAVCTPPGTHAEIASRAARAGVHVVVEKPPARTGAELDAMLAAAREGGVLAAVMLQHRFVLPDLDGIGTLRGARADVRVSRPRPESHYVGAGWRSDPEQALGGIVAHLGVHYLDLACRLLGQPRAVVVDPAATVVGGIDLEVSGRVEFARDNVLTFTVTSRRAERGEHLAVAADGLCVRVDDGALAVEVDGDRSERPARPTPQLRTEVYAELAAAAAGRRPLRTAALEHARAVTAVLEQVADEVRGR